MNILQSCVALSWRVHSLSWVSKIQNPKPYPLLRSKSNIRVSKHQMIIREVVDLKSTGSKVTHMKEYSLSWLMVCQPVTGIYIESEILVHTIIHVIRHVVRGSRCDRKLRHCLD